MKEDQSSFCGKEGRQARAFIRAMLADDFIPAMMGYKYDGTRALSHAGSCSNCHGKISEQVLNNPATVYSSTIEETLLRARQTYQGSEEKFVYPELADNRLEPVHVGSSNSLDKPLLIEISHDSSPISALVPSGIENILNSRELNFRNIPQLQKVAIITYLLLNAKEHFYEESASKRAAVASRDFEEVRKKKKEAGEEGDGISLDDLLSYSKNFIKTWIETDERDREKLPEIVAQKISDKGNPFGFDPEVVRAILEMANDFYETQLSVDSIKIGTYDPDWQPIPTKYLTNVMEDMFEHGGSSGRNPFSRTKFPAGNYYHEIFTPEASRQMQHLIKERYQR